MTVETVREQTRRWRREANERFELATAMRSQFEHAVFASEVFMELPMTPPGIEVVVRSENTDGETDFPHDLFERVYKDRETGLEVATFSVCLDEDYNWDPMVAFIKRTDSPAIFDYSYAHPDYVSGEKFVLQQSTVWYSDRKFRKRGVESFVEQILLDNGPVTDASRYRIVEERIYKPVESQVNMITKKGIWEEETRMVIGGNNSHTLYLIDDTGFLRETRRLTLERIRQRQGSDVTLDGQFNNYEFTERVLGKAESVLIA